MSAGGYTRRINVQTQARNSKVQYPGGRAVYNPIWATCASNPIFTTLNYNSIICCKPSAAVNSCVPTPNEILDGQFSGLTIGCILDGGFSNSNYSPVLDGGNS
jgi:hypothetical protein